MHFQSHSFYGRLSQGGPCPLMYSLSMCQYRLQEAKEVAKIGTSRSWTFHLSEIPLDQRLLFQLMPCGEVTNASANGWSPAVKVGGALAVTLGLCLGLWRLLSWTRNATSHVVNRANPRLTNGPANGITRDPTDGTPDSS